MKIRKILIALFLFLSIAMPSWSAASRDFDGVDDVVDFASASVIDSFTNKTIALWVKLDTYGEDSQGVPINKRGTLKGWQIFIVGLGFNQYEFEERFSTIDGEWTVPVDSNPLDTWTHIATTFNNSSDANDPILYINGNSVTVSEPQPPSGTVVDDATNRFVVGAQTNTGNIAYDGRIAYVHYYNRILTGAEIQQIMRHPGSIADGLKLYAPLWGDSTEIDLSGNGNTGTVTGSVTSADGPPVMITLTNP